MGQNKQIERNTTFGLIFFFFSSVYDCIWNKSAELSFAVVSECLIVEQCPVSLQAVATMEIRTTSSFSSSNPVFFVENEVTWYEIAPWPVQVRVCSCAPSQLLAQCWDVLGGRMAADGLLWRKLTPSWPDPAHQVFVAF